jgi:hypothetical protein
MVTTIFVPGSNLFRAHSDADVVFSEIIFQSKVCYLLLYCFQSCLVLKFEHYLNCRVGAVIFHGTGLIALFTFLFWIQAGER